jgi:hypothetical protein
MLTTDLKIGDTRHFTNLGKILTLERIINQGKVDDSDIIFIETICKDEEGLFYLCDCSMMPVAKAYSSLEELAKIHGSNGITEFNELQLLAKDIYLAEVLADTYRQSFIKKLKEGVPVFDLRKEGYYCSYCKSFSKKSTAFGVEDKVIFVNNDTFDKGKQQIWIINSHYDGCRGWE